MANKTVQTDVLIVGAGLVGLAAAIAMHEAGHQVCVVDRNNPMKALTKSKLGKAWDARMYAISPKNAEWLTSLGVWPSVDQTRLAPMRGMALWGDASTTPLSFDADDVHAQNLGYIVESKQLMRALLEKVKALGIETKFGAECLAVETTDTRTTVTLKTSARAKASQLECQLLLAADGGQSWVRQQLNMPLQTKAYEHTAVVANFKASLSHNGVAHQWFKNDAQDIGLQVLAWLPLPDDMISIVWSVPPSMAEQLMALDGTALAAQVAEAGGQRLGALALVTEAASFPLQLSTVQSPVHHSVVLLGDAAHRIHPMAGQGVNVGFRDVENLVTTLAKKHQYQAINDAQRLKQYERLRQLDVKKLVTLTDGLYRLFSSQSRLIKKVRHWGFEATKQQVIKELLVKQAVDL